MSPIVLSLSVGLAATLASLPAAVLVAFTLERAQWRGRTFLQALVMMPLVLPPVVVGYGLLRLFSPRGGIGRLLETLHAPVAFHWLGAVVAAGVVGFPLLVMQIGLAMKAVDPRLEAMSRSLGRGPVATFLRVTLPLSWPGCLSGSLVAFARGLGEFGATIVLAGRIPGETETIPLAIYAALDSPEGEGHIVHLVLASVAICLACVLAARLLDGYHVRRLEIEG